MKHLPGQFDLFGTAALPLTAPDARPSPKPKPAPEPERQRWLAVATSPTGEIREGLWSQDDHPDDATIRDKLRIDQSWAVSVQPSKRETFAPILDD